MEWLVGLVAGAVTGVGFFVRSTRVNRNRITQAFDDGLREGVRQGKRFGYMQGYGDARAVVRDHIARVKAAELDDVDD